MPSQLASPHLNAQASDSGENSSTRTTPDVPEDSAVLAAERGHPATHNDTNRTVGAPTPRSAPGFTVCPTRSIHVVNWNDGTLVDLSLLTIPPDPPSQFYSRVAIPLLPYACGNTQKHWSPGQPIPFSTNGHLGVKLPIALYGNFRGIDNQDDFPLGKNQSGITIRIHFPGYPSSTRVEKVLKASSEVGGMQKARSMRLATRNYKSMPEPVTKSKLVQEVSKRIQWHISDLESNSDLFPFDSLVGEEWRLGHGRMKFEHMVITALKNVSAGSWSPVICHE